MPQLRVRPVQPADRAAWEALFRDYRAFCGRDHDPAVVNAVWVWLLDPEHEAQCLVAEAVEVGAKTGAEAGRVVALAHFRRYARTVDADHALHLDDLYVAGDARRLGAARAILDELGRIAGDEGARFVRWVTASDNATARDLYERVAEQADWVTFELAPEPVGAPAGADAAASAPLPG